MKITVIGSTQVGHVMPKETAVDFSGMAAGICYLPQTMAELLSEPLEKTAKRAQNNIRLGHHSVFGHATYNLVLEDVPKIVAMLLNNEKAYTTSEKSARYTRMQCTPEEQVLYDKWLELFVERIQQIYPELTDRHTLKLAQENARYLISVFTPATVMEYTVSFGQLNYILSWAREFIAAEPPTDEKVSVYKNFPCSSELVWVQTAAGPFYQQLRGALQEFLAAMPDLTVEGLNTGAKHRGFSLIAKPRWRREEFGENYCTTYWASLAQLAQAQRHRTLSYEMMVPDASNFRFYVPPIIEGTDLGDEWLRDIGSLAKNYPQGMQVIVNERGTLENFVLKCTERLCGAAQLEIARQTRQTLDNYQQQLYARGLIDEYALLEPYLRGPRCTFPDWSCEAPCAFGPQEALTRSI